MKDDPVPKKIRGRLSLFWDVNRCVTRDAVRILLNMTFDRQALLRVCDDLLDTGISNVLRDGFLVETLIGFRRDGSLVSFVSAPDGVDADITRQYITEDEENITVIDGRLIDSSKLIALDLSRRGATSVAHLAAGTLDSSGEIFVLSSVVWPHEILIHSKIAMWQKGGLPHIQDGGQPAVQVLAWLAELLPEPVLTQAE